MKKQLKKLGYGYAVHYNGFRKKFEVYRIGDWTPGTEITNDSKVSINSNPKRAIKMYIKKYINA